MSTSMSSGPSIARTREMSEEAFPKPLGLGARKQIAGNRVQSMGHLSRNRVYLTPSWLQEPMRVMASFAVLRNLPPPPFHSGTFRRWAGAGPFPALASNSGGDDKA
jgi:hypothetical protein